MSIPSDIFRVVLLQQRAESCVKAGRYCEAMEILNEAIQAEPENIQSRETRSEVYWLIGEHRQALEDAQAVLDRNPGYNKAILYKARSLIGLRRYLEAMRVLSRSTPLIPDDHMLDSVQSRLSDEVTGTYDMNYYLNQMTKGQETYSDGAEFTGPITIIYHPEKGRTYVAAEDIRAGQLIMVSRAIATCEYRPQLREEIVQRVLPEKVMNVLKDNPQFVTDVLRLYMGPKSPTYLVMNKDFNEETLRRHVLKACRYNYFISDYFARNHRVGLWIQPSYFNHVCVGANAFHVILKDTMFVRATRGVLMNEELLVNKIPPFSSHADRMQYSQTRSLRCSCELCQFEIPRRSEIHSRRDEILDDIVRGPSDILLSPRMLERLRRDTVLLKRLKNTEDGIDFHVVKAEQALINQFAMQNRYDIVALMSKRHFDQIVSVDSRVALASLVRAFSALQIWNVPSEIEKLKPILQHQLYTHFGDENIDPDLLDFLF